MQICAHVANVVVFFVRLRSILQTDVCYSVKFGLERDYCFRVDPQKKDTRNHAGKDTVSLQFWFKATILGCSLSRRLSKNKLCLRYYV